MKDVLNKVKVRTKVELVNCKINPSDKTIKIGDKVIFEDNSEKKYGIVLSLQTLPREEENALPIIVDFSSMHSQEELKKIEDAEQEVLKVCREKAEKHKLEMNFVKAEYSLDMAKIVVYFTANKRVDFRELVKDVNNLIKGRGRLELWQISSREKAFIIGGSGVCGREICCRATGKIPETVSIRSVKDQGLEVNPLKITGLCGKLMCCLTYEHVQYIEMAENFPKEGITVLANGRKGIVKSNNFIKNTITVEFEDSIAIEFKKEDVLVANN